MDDAISGIWNLITGLFLAVFSFAIKSYSDKVLRLEGKLQATREEIARDHITRAEYRADMDKLVQRMDAGFTKLEAKLDSLGDHRR